MQTRKQKYHRPLHPCQTPLFDFEIPRARVCIAPATESDHRRISAPPITSRCIAAGIAIASICFTGIRLRPVRATFEIGEQDRSRLSDDWRCSGACACRQFPEITIAALSAPGRELVPRIASIGR